jgi:hypothetical protein
MNKVIILVAMILPQVIFYSPENVFVAIFFKKWNPIRLLQNLNFSQRQANDSEYSCINAIIEHCTSPSIFNVRVCSWLKFKFGGELIGLNFSKEKDEKHYCRKCL